MKASAAGPQIEQRGQDFTPSRVGLIVLRFFFLGVTLAVLLGVGVGLVAVGSQSLLRAWLGTNAARASTLLLLSLCVAKGAWDWRDRGQKAQPIQAPRRAPNSFTTADKDSYLGSEDFDAHGTLWNQIDHVARPK